MLAKLTKIYGFDADSCTNTRIEDCYIVSGDDCVAVKSGWDEYGIAYGMPTKLYHLGKDVEMFSNLPGLIPSVFGDVTGARIVIP